jgi:hypothetical protein
MLDLRNVRIQKFIDGQSLGNLHWFETCVKVGYLFAACGLGFENIVRMGGLEILMALP